MPQSSRRVARITSRLIDGKVSWVMVCLSRCSQVQPGGCPACLVCLVPHHTGDDEALGDGPHLCPVDAEGVAGGEELPGHLGCLALHEHLPDLYVPVLPAGGAPSAAHVVGTA